MLCQKTYQIFPSQRGLAKHKDAFGVCDMVLSAIEEGATHPSQYLLPVLKSRSIRPSK